MLAVLEELVELHARFNGLLIDRIRQDRYPSSSMMDMVEQGLRFEDVRDYVEVLMEKIEQDKFPSIPMMRRLERLIG